MSFQCTQCGNCCTGAPGFVWFSAEEGRAIAEHLGISEPEFYERHCKKALGRWTLDERHTPISRYDCVFLERDASGKGRCSIYPVRPTQCRTWPFWRSNVKSRAAWDQAATTCPGMRRGGVFVPAEQVRVLVESNPRGL